MGFRQHVCYPQFYVNYSHGFVKTCQISTGYHKYVNYLEGSVHMSLFRLFRRQVNYTQGSIDMSTIHTVPSTCQLSTRFCHHVTIHRVPSTSQLYTRFRLHVNYPQDSVNMSLSTGFHQHFHYPHGTINMSTIHRVLSTCHYPEDSVNKATIQRVPSTCQQSSGFRQKVSYTQGSIHMLTINGIQLTCQLSLGFSLGLGGHFSFFRFFSINFNILLIKHCRESLWRIPMALLEMVRLEEAHTHIKVFIYTFKLFSYRLQRSDLRFLFYSTLSPLPSYSCEYQLSDSTFEPLLRIQID